MTREEIKENFRMDDWTITDEYNRWFGEKVKSPLTNIQFEHWLTYKETGRK